MAKFFNTAAVCIPGKHYMVNLDKRMEEIRSLVDGENYFKINRARQYGKTTTLIALEKYLQKDYHVVSMDFQTFGNEEFADENTFALSFASTFMRLLFQTEITITNELKVTADRIQNCIDESKAVYRLKRLFEDLTGICKLSDKPIVLMIDEVDSVSDNQVFLDFLAQLRACYIRRTMQPAFHSVILAGVYDIRNMNQKLRPQEEHKVNSPWNIAADFKVEMSFSKKEIAGMLSDYEEDVHTGMDVEGIAQMLSDYTSGYPFLVSRLCKLMDEEVSAQDAFGTKSAAWTKAGFHEAVRLILSEKNTLFESFTGKLMRYPALDSMLRALLFTGKTIAYDSDNPDMDMATMFGFIRNQNGTVEIANRIFEMRLYNRYLAESQMQKLDIYKASLQDKNQFIVDGHLNMRRILEKFVEHFHELYGDREDRFKEEEGRSYFLLYLRPIINGTGNYYIESRTRSLGRTDVIVDYHGEQFVIEMKIWHGREYNNRGEKQLVRYLDDYQQKKGYMLSFNFNKKKEIGMKEIVIGDKLLVEAVV